MLGLTWSSAGNSKSGEGMRDAEDFATNGLQGSATCHAARSAHMACNDLFEGHAVLSVCLSVCLSVFLFVCLSTCNMHVSNQPPSWIRAPVICSVFETSREQPQDDAVEKTAIGNVTTADVHDVRGGLRLCHVVI
jgi:hypothetical protein